MLRGTDSDHRITRHEVQDRVAGILPLQPRAVLNKHVNSALTRMTKKTVRHWKQPDEFCLTFQERQRVSDRLAKLELEEGAFTGEIRAGINAVAEALDIDLAGKLPKLDLRVKFLLDLFVLKRGEAFASAVVSGEFRGGDVNAVKDLVIADVAQTGDAGLGGNVVELLTKTLEEVIRRGGPASQRYLRRSADAYTLFAFLREAPDVQRVVEKLFSYGWVWLDTTIVLPAMAETLLDEEQQRFSLLLRTARDAGLRLRITPGVVEEVERHINRSRVCHSEAGSWLGRIPFLLQMYDVSGYPRSDFPGWTEQFAGKARPEDDVADYLHEVFGIELQSLEEEANAADMNLRGAVQEVWHAAHTSRRREQDSITINRLIAHDVENYIGVITRRKKERDSPVGYTSWWLTLDPTAFIVRRVLRDRLAGRVPDSPVLSPDFLATYLTVGPMRRNVSKDAERQLPFLLDLGTEEVPPELLKVAATAREDARGRPERVVRREVRDAIDKAKRKQGPIAQEGMAGIEGRIREQLAKNRGNRPPS